MRSSARAQTWSAGRARPPLFQIISVDATGETNWRYGAEDIAGDGRNTFATAEQQLDLRTSYASPESDRLWLRSYVSASSQPPTTLVAFYFFDTDLNSKTGGSAAATEVFPALGADPSQGGYEQVIGVRGDGTVVGHYRWNASRDEFVRENDPANAIQPELGVARDPIAFGSGNRGYVQFSVTHASSGLDGNCRSRIFVRLWNDVPSGAYGDDDVAPAACIPGENAFGDPVVLRSDACDADADCPADGRCREHVCVFAYGCDTAADCRADERCEAQACVRVVPGACTEDSDCDGLVCEAGACVACTDSGARACEAGRLCTPGGSCIEPGKAAPVDSNSDNGGVRGGAFRCAAGASASIQPALPVAIALLVGAWIARRSRRRAAAGERGTRPGGES